MPYKIPEVLATWLDTAPQQGHLRDTKFAYHGQVRLRPNEMGRRIELVTNISQGVVRYEPTWPKVENLSARIHVAGRSTHIQISSADSLDVNLAGSRIELRENGQYAQAQINAAGEAGQLLAFVRQSPLLENLSFVTPQWQMTGGIALQGDLLIPLKKELSPPLKVGFDFSLSDVGLTMPEYRSELKKLSGPVGSIYRMR